MKYALHLSSRFKKSYKRISRNSKFNIEEYKKVVSELMLGNELNPKYKNHKLKGEYVGCMECHLQNDILLVYYYIEKELVLYAVDIGSHSELF